MRGGRKKKSRWILDARHEKEKRNGNDAGETLRPTSYAVDAAADDSIHVLIGRRYIAKYKHKVEKKHETQ